MRTDEARGRSLLDAPVRFPDHVTFRSFVQETVALNLQTGQFHGLNATAGRMVELVGRCSRPRDAVGALASEYGVPEQQIEDDLVALLAELLERDLIELAI
jgi:hypothetical protein